MYLAYVDLKNLALRTYTTMSHQIIYYLWGRQHAAIHISEDIRLKNAKNISNIYNYIFIMIPFKE